MSTRSTAPHPATRHRSDIQGLRALAVLLVLVYHAGLPFLPGGFVGVDVFFVISGFLITSQLLKGIHEHGRVDLVDFYGRRARRILPAALLALVGTVLLTLAILPRSRWDAVATEATGSVLFVVNWIFGQSSTDYLRQDEAASPLQHYWSLAVEEQFYLLWPLVLILVLFLARRSLTRDQRPDAGRSRRRGGASLAVIQRRLIVGAAVFLFIVSLLHSMHFTTANPGLAYFATTTRIYELGVGVLLALFATQFANLPRIPALVLGWIGLAAMIVAGATFSGATWFPGSSALVPTLGAAAVIISGLNGRDRTGVGALLSLRPVTWIGDISYSLYLWHWPLLVMATFLFDGLPWYVGVLTAALSVLPAWASYRWVEQPFQRWTVVRSPWKAIQMGLAASLAVIMGSVFLGAYSSRPAVASGWEQPTYERALERARSAGAEPPVGGELLQQDPVAALTQTSPDTLLPGPETVNTDLPEAYGQGCMQSDPGTDPQACTYGPDDAGFRVALVGDSHAAHWLPAVNRLAAENDWQVNAYLKTSCPFTTGQVLLKEEVFTQCEQWNAGVMQELQAGGFDLVLTSTSTYAAPAGQTSVPEGYAGAWSSVEETGTPVGVLMDPKAPGYNIPECLETHPDSYMGECGYAQSESDTSGSTHQEQALQHTDAAVPLELTAGICPEGTCPPVIGNVVVWRDKSHLTATYAESMAPWLGTALEEQGLIPSGS